jgi:ribonucleotide monophosphatase NagD (HAD superfamily)
MDGVVWHVDDPIRGAKEALQSLVTKGKHIFFVTNNSMHKSDAVRNCSYCSTELPTLFFFSLPKNYLVYN